MFLFEVGDLSRFVFFLIRFDSGDILRSEALALNELYHL